MLSSGDTKSELKNNATNELPTDREEVKISDENLNQEIIQTNGHPSLDCNSESSSNKAELAEWNCLFKTNQQLLDEVKNLTKSKRVKNDNVKCDNCVYKKLKQTNCGVTLTDIFYNNVLMHTNCITELDLSNNNIEEFPEIITELANLSVLNLSYNKLQIIPNTCILLKKLRCLNLSHNQIGYQTPKCLELGLEFITELNLSFNSIYYFLSPPKCVSFLESLNLSYNIISYVPRWLFSEKCRNLINLNLSGTLITPKDFLWKVQEAKYLRTNILKTLKCLSLTNCNISIPNLEIINYFENICYLNIGNDFVTKLEEKRNNNNIWDLPLNMLSNPDKITALFIYNIGLPTLPNELYLWKNLKVLNASFNCLTWLPETFVQFQCLEVIDLSHNKLVHLPPRFNQMVSIKELYLSDNKLSDVEGELNLLSNLEVLDLYNNSLESMPVSDDQLRRLTKFDVSYNHVSVEMSLNHNFEDGENALDFYKKLEENLRCSFEGFAFRLNGSCCRSYPSSIDSSSDSSSSSSPYEDEEYLNAYEDEEYLNEEETANYEVAVEEEEWGADTDNEFDPHAHPIRSSYSVFPTTVPTTYTEEKEHSFAPYRLWSKYQKKNVTRSSNSVDHQFSDADTSN